MKKVEKEFFSLKVKACWVNFFNLYKTHYYSLYEVILLVGPQLFQSKLLLLQFQCLIVSTKESGFLCWTTTGWLIGVLCDFQEFHFDLNSLNQFPLHFHLHSTHRHLQITREMDCFQPLLVSLASFIIPTENNFSCWERTKVNRNFPFIFVPFLHTQKHTDKSQYCQEWPHNTHHKIKLLSWSWSACGQNNNVCGHIIFYSVSSLCWKVSMWCFCSGQANPKAFFMKLHVASY